MRLGLYLRTGRGAAVLRAALRSGVVIAYVYAERDEAMPHDGSDEIFALADEADIPVFGSKNRVGNPASYLGPTHIIAAGWRTMLAEKNLIVMHDSLLPRWRGWAPTITALIHGDRTVGVTAILAEGTDEFDVGPIVGQKTLPVVYPAKIADVLSGLEPLYEQLTEGIILDWPTSGRPQHGAGATYSVWRDHDDYRIDWNDAAGRIRRVIDACGHPHPGAWTTVNGVQVRITDAEQMPDVVMHERHVGKVLMMRDRKPVVICGKGLLRILDARYDAERGPLEMPFLPLGTIRTRFA